MLGKKKRKQGVGEMPVGEQEGNKCVRPEAQSVEGLRIAST